VYSKSTAYNTRQRTGIAQHCISKTLRSHFAGRGVT